MKSPIHRFHHPMSSSMSLLHFIALGGFILLHIFVDINKVILGQINYMLNIISRAVLLPMMVLECRGKAISLEKEKGNFIKINSPKF